MAALRRGPLRDACLGAVLLSLLIRGLSRAAGAPHAALYFLTPMRLDGLAVGALLAVLARRPGGLDALVPWARRTILGVGLLVATLLGWSMIDPAGSDRSGLAHWRADVLSPTAFAALFGATLVVTAASPRGAVVSRLRASRTLTLLGRHSYALYLVHGTVIVLLAPLVPPPPAGLRIVWDVAATLGFGGLSLAISVVIWHVLEKPILRLKRHFPYGEEPLV